MRRPVEVVNLGRMGYEAALAQQTIHAEQRLAGLIPDTLLLVEHDHVYTIGRTNNKRSLGESPETLPHPLFEISRGGQATYHGPGQLLGYPILDLRDHGQDLHRYLRALEESLITYCTALGLKAHRNEGQTGVWVAQRKIASIGVGVRRWISMHGFALNVCNALDPFAWITPCGIDGVEMTSLQKELPGSTISWEDAAKGYPPHLEAALAAATA